MSIHWIFHAEERSGEVWQIPVELPPVHRCCPIGGEFGWMPENWISRHLFFGAGALFPFTRGHPSGPSEFCRLWDAYWPGWDSDADKATHWIDFERLYVALWDDPAVLVQSYVPVRLACLFGDGIHILPEAELLTAGATGDDIWRLRKSVKPASVPINRMLGVGRGELESLRPDQMIPVSWQTSITWMLPTCADRFRELRRLGDARDLRIIAWRG